MLTDRRLVLSVSYAGIVRGNQELIYRSAEMDSLCGGMKDGDQVCGEAKWNVGQCPIIDCGVPAAFN